MRCFCCCDTVRLTKQRRRRRRLAMRFVFVNPPLTTMSKQILNQWLPVIARVMNSHPTRRPNERTTKQKTQQTLLSPLCVHNIHSHFYCVIFSVWFCVARCSRSPLTHTVACCSHRYWHSVINVAIFIHRDVNTLAKSNLCEWKLSEAFI